MPDLQVLKLSTNKIGDQGAFGLAMGLVHCQHLLHLELHTNLIGDEGACELGKSLQCCGYIEDLDLENNEIGDRGVRGLAQGLEHCTNLRNLVLADNCIGDEGAWELGNRLQCWTPQARGYHFKLSLQNNQIDDKGVLGLSNGLKNCEASQTYHFELKGNLIGENAPHGDIPLIGTYHRRLISSELGELVGAKRPRR